MLFAVLGNPENRRVTAFCEATGTAGFLPPQVISWSGLLRDNKLPELPSGKKICFRIDSPGENPEVREALVLKGLKQDSAAEASELMADFGRIGFTKAWYNGFAQLLQETIVPLTNNPDVSFMNHPDDMLTLFDKRKCHALMRRNDVPVPDALPPVKNYEELRAAMRHAGMSRVFIKPVHTSSASGVIAFRSQKKKTAAITSAEIVSSGNTTRLYNNLQLQVYRDEKTVANLIDTILAEDAIVEQWIPKAMYRGQVFDLRILVIAGKARHIVVRRSKSVITNLHLGNERGDVDELYFYIGNEKFEALKHTAEKAAACFSRSLYIAVDVLLAADLKTIRVLECNAFGDLLPGVLSEGQSTYAAEIAAVKQRMEIKTTLA